MVSRTDLMEAGTSIENALKDWLTTLGHEDVVAEAWESMPGHIRAVVASDYFKGIGIATRQELVWNRLKENVDPNTLRLCFGVHVLDIEEYLRSGGSQN